MKTHREKGYNCACLFCDAPKDSEYYKNIVANTEDSLSRLEERNPVEVMLKGLIWTGVIVLISLGALELFIVIFV